jgi:hypothetical protein
MPGATVEPGNIPGTLTVQSSVALAGLLVLELNRSNAQTSDRLVSTVGVIVAGGTLTVTNLGPALQPGDIFQLFSVAVNGFTTVNLPPLPAGSAWINNLASSGSIRVVSTGPTTLAWQVIVGSALMLSWPGDHIGWRLQAQTNNLGIALGTNWVDVAGAVETNQLTLPIGSNDGSGFFRLVYP